jgi:DNA-binding transcriptional LysR family regulator
MHFDLVDLRLYLHILEAGNITAGAAHSHLSLAAASARIRALEASLGTAFFERGRRGVTPTPAGLALAEHARILLQQAERMQHELAEYAQGFKGRVRLPCNTAALTEYLPELLADFLREHPHISIDLQEMTSLHIAQAIRQGAADLGIVADSVDTRDLCTRAFRDTLGHDYVGLGANSALAIHLEEQALRSGLRLQVRIRAEGFDGVLRMVAHGAGLGIVPLATLQRWPNHEAFICRPLTEPWAQRKLLLCARDFTDLPVYVRALLQALSQPKA